MKKRYLILIIIIILIAVALAILGILFRETLADFITEPFKTTSDTQPSQTKPSAPSSPSSPSRPNPCANINDTYELPDFNSLLNSMKDEPFVQDFPKTGSLRMRFYHFTQGCRIWDKSYYISGGTVIESNNKADIDVWMHSDYVEMFKTKDLCEVLETSRNNGDFGQWSDLSQTTLLWRYKSMLKYKDCLGV